MGNGIRVSMMGIILLLSACDSDKPDAPLKEEDVLSSYDMSVALQLADRVPDIEKMVRFGYCKYGCSEEIYFLLDGNYVSNEVKAKQLTALLKGNNDISRKTIAPEKKWGEFRPQQASYGGARGMITILPKLPYDLIKILLESAKVDASILDECLYHIISDWNREGYQLTDEQTMSLLQLSENHGIDLSKHDVGGRFALPDLALNYGKPKTFEFLVGKGRPIGKELTYFTYAELISKMGDQADPKFKIFNRIRKLGGDLYKRDGNGLNPPEWAVYSNSDHQKLIIGAFARAGVTVDKRRIKKAEDDWNSYNSTRRTAHALSPSETLGGWRNASYSEKLDLAQMMADRLNKPGISASYLVNCINDTAGKGGLDYMKISETAAACAVLN